MEFPSPYYRWRPHPWHGLDAGTDLPRIVNAYIELTPFDLVKYEVDKTTGYLRVDRPQKTSSQPPTLYGFIPRTYCGERVRQLMPAATQGDGDPLDICIVSERPIGRSEVIVEARVVGGLPMVDDGEADDKIIAVLANDPLWMRVEDIGDFPEALVERVQHYFSTYKLTMGAQPPVEIGEAYDREHAETVITAALADYEEAFGQ